MKAVIFCNGIIEDYSFIDKNSFNDALIICADGGLRHAYKLGVEIFAVIGDSDSRTDELPNGVEVIDCPTEKDYTDTKRCIDYAIKRGSTVIELYGALGGRRDQEFSHFALMAYALKQGVELRIIDKYNLIFMKDLPFSLEKCDFKYVSFFPFGGVVPDLTITGLKYETDSVFLDFDSVLTVSNEFSNENTASVKFSKGRLIVFFSDDKR